MPDNDLLKNFLEGKPPLPLRMMAARGLLPIPPHQMLRLLVHLAQDQEPEVAKTAAQTISGWNEKDIVAELQSSECRPELFEHFAESKIPALQEAIILNPAAPGEVIAKLAATVPGSLVETILYNRTRILSCPAILENLKLNPFVTPQVLVLVKEIETEFFGEKRQEYKVVELEEEAPAEEELGLETELPPGDLSLEGLPADAKEREAALVSRISTLTVRQKIQLALMGNREVRAVLIRDANREVSRSVLESPKLTKNEVEAFAAMRNVSEDVLRLIGSSKQWARSYTVAQNLAKNPKTPPLISQRMMSRLQAKDLMLLARDRGISESVRSNAQRILAQRNKTHSIG